MEPTFGSDEEVAQDFALVQRADVNTIRRSAIGSLGRYIFQRVIGQERQDHGHVAGSRGLGCADLTICMDEAMHSTWSEAERQCGLFAPQRGGHIDVLNIAQDARSQKVFVECGFIPVEPTVNRA